MRRLSYAFSKRPEYHRAAAALTYVGLNLTRIVRTLRVTPAMQAGVTDHVWSLDELLDVLLSEGPASPPEPKPLQPREPTGPARQTPGGSWLRLVPGQAPAAAPEPTPARPRRPMRQLSLFDPPPDDRA